MNSPLFAILVKVTVFTLMLTIGVNLSLEKLVSLWHTPKKLIISLVAVIVIVPAVVIFLLSIFNLPPHSASVLAILAASPGAPLTTKRSQMAGGHISDSASIQLTLALIAVIITPLTLSLFYTLFDLDIEQVKILHIAKQVTQVQFIPVIIGLLLQKFSPNLVSKYGKILNLIANILLIIMALVLLPVAIPLIFQTDRLSIVAIVIMAIASLATGHFLGGKAINERSVLAIACLARNIGLALCIITLSENSAKFIPTLVSYMILGAIFAIPYSTWSKRQLAKKTQNS